MRDARIAALLAVALVLPARADDLAVAALGASVPTQCAETDNVSITFSSPAVRSFTVEAAHPAYLGDLSADSKAADFDNCSTARGTDHRFEPRRVTLHDAGNWRLVGYVYPSFWRAAQVPVHVGDRTEVGLHLLQLWTRGRVRDEEMLVLYPADGYWRARPLAPAKLAWTPDPSLPTAYGSSFLVGPVEADGRPFVDIADVVFDPAAASFRLAFARGGAATLRVSALTEEHIVLAVTLDPVPAQPFAALRSMFVSEDNADVAGVAWRTPGGERDASGIMDFWYARVTAFWAGRTQPSHHNTSAPDMRFRDFRAAPR